MFFCEVKRAISSLNDFLGKGAVELMSDIVTDKVVRPRLWDRC